MERRIGTRTKKCKADVAVETEDGGVTKNCSLCGLTAGPELCYNQHTSRSIKSGHIAYKCKTCKYKAFDKSWMKRHVGSHTGEWRSCALIASICPLSEAC